VLLDGTLVCAHGASRVNTRIAGVLTPFSLDPRTTFGRGGPGECHRLYVLQQQQRGGHNAGARKQHGEARCRISRER